MDLTQEVYLKIYGAIQSFDESRPLLPWIKRIAVNTCLNHKRQQRLPVEELLERHQVDEGSSPEKVLMRESDHNALQEAITTLPERERMAMVLRHIKGLSYEEVAAAMNCPLGTVKTYLYRGRNTLRRILRDSGVWGDDV